jgi:hypothetical protein
MASRPVLWCSDSKGPPGEPLCCATRNHLSDTAARPQNRTLLALRCGPMLLRPFGGPSGGYEVHRKFFVAADHEAVRPPDGRAVLLRSRAGSNARSFQTSRIPDQNVVVHGELIEVEPWEVDRWCRNHLDSGIDEELFRYGHLSAVIGIRLISGPQVVVKVRRRFGAFR